MHLNLVTSRATGCMPFLQLVQRPGFNSYDSPALKATIYPITAAAPNRIAIVARPRGNDWLAEEVSALSQEGLNIVVSMLTDEEVNELGLGQESAECEVAGIGFTNMAIPDRSVPSDRNIFLLNVEQLAELVREGRYLGVHCRASIGRSSILAASVLVRLGWDANAAFDAIESARGCPVPDTPEQKLWVISNVPALR
jgi:protein-tyrosine phosphatase